MKKRKVVIPIIWIIVLIITFICTNIIPYMIIAFINNTSNIYKYVEKADKILYPDKYEKEFTDIQYSSVLSLRTLLDDNRVCFFESLPLRFYSDQSIRYISKNGTTDYMSGTFINVYKECDRDINLSKDTIGLVSINQMANSKYANTLIDLLEKNQNAKLRIDQYIQDGFMFTPISISLINPDGTVYFTVYDNDLIYSDKIKESEDIYIYHIGNLDAAENFYDIADYDVCRCMKVALLKREVDKRADNIIEDFDLSILDSDDTEIKTFRNTMFHGLGYTKCEHIVYSGNYAMVILSYYSYFNLILILYCVLALVWTGIMAYIYMKPKKKIKDKKINQTKEKEDL